MYYSFDLWFTLILCVAVLGVVLGLCAYLILAERKIAAWAQDRIGPNRVGPFGLLQPIADGAKFLLKEDIIPDHVDKVFYLLAPTIAIITSLLAIAVVPVGSTSSPPTRPWPQTVQQEQELREKDPQFAEDLEAYNQQPQYVIAPNIDIGFLFLFAIGSLSVYAVILGGWSSNNKYSFLGALRSS